MRLIRIATATALAALAVGVPVTARAAPYEAFIDLETEDDLYDLRAAEQIGDETFEILLDLLQRGVDLSTATRAELYTLPNLTYADVDAILRFRAVVGVIRDPAELVGAGALSEDKLLAIAAFLLVGDQRPGGPGTHGWVRAGTRAAQGDRTAPPIALRARITAVHHLTVGGAATLTRQQAADVVYDPNRDALIADAPGVRPQLPKLYARWTTAAVDAIVGTYRIGFGQRLVFDTTGAYSPDGIALDDQLVRPDELTRRCKESAGELPASPCEGDAGYEYETRDFRWRDALLGAAVGARDLAVGPGHLQAYAWGSYQPRSIYQYELYDAGRCADPRADDQPGCSAPDVFRRPDGDLLTPTSELSFQTLPAMYAEGLAGGHVAYHLDRRNYVGITGYGATTRWLVDGMDLDFQEWSRAPTGGPFGALGASVAVGREWADLGVEVAHSFDSMADPAGPVDGSGGPAVIIRATATGASQVVEAVLRYYDTNFLNPHGHPTAAADELEGQRARDELGARVHYAGSHGAAAVRTGVDVWTNPSTDTLKGEVFARADVTATDQVRWGLALALADKDLERGSRGACYQTPVDVDVRGEPVECTGMRLSTIGRLRLTPDRALSMSTQLQHQLVDDPAHPDGFRQDVSAWAIAVYKARPGLRLRGRVRYLFEDVVGDADLEQSLWSYLEATMRLRSRDTLRVRADLVWWLDDRLTSQRRTPDPELWLWLDYEARF